MLRNIHCDCLACIKDYPLIDDLSAPSVIPNISESIDSVRLFNFSDVKFAESVIPILQEFLTEYSNVQTPCQQICYAQMNYRMVYDILCKMSAFHCRFREPKKSNL